MGGAHFQGSMPIQMPEPLELMTLSANRMPCTKSASEKRYSGAISTAQFMRLKKVLPATTPLLDLMSAARPRRLPTVLFRMAKPLPLAEGQDTTSSNSTSSKLLGQLVNFTCAQPAG